MTLTAPPQQSLTEVAATPAKQAAASSPRARRRTVTTEKGTSLSGLGACTWTVTTTRLPVGKPHRLGCVSTRDVPG